MRMIQGTFRLVPGILFSIVALARLHAEAPATFKVGELTFTRPAKWEWVEVTTPMRKAQLKVPNTQGGAAAEVVFFQFPGGAGSTQANVNRWLGQFAEPRDKINAKIDEATVGKTKVTYVQAEGTYKSGMPGGPHTEMPDYALVGAIIQSDPDNIFVRMTGPKELVMSSVGDFKRMIEDGLNRSD